MADDHPMDKKLTQEAIKFFMTLISHRKMEGKDTRPINFAGNIGRHMDKRLKTWFTNRYPTNNDYVKFFIQNDNDFAYDKHTGNVDINATEKNVQILPAPYKMMSIETEARSAKSLSQVSDLVAEAELFLLVIKLLNENFENKNNTLKTRAVAVRLRSDQKLNWLCHSLPTLSLTDPNEAPHDFESELLLYLANNYSQVFFLDSNSKAISFKLPIIEQKKKFESNIDDLVYSLFKSLVEQYIRWNGQPIDQLMAVEVDRLYDKICNRHPVITDRIFIERKTADDYNLVKFCQSYPKTFTVQVYENLESIWRRICVRIPSEKAKNVIENDITNRDKPNGNDSDSEIYESDSESVNKSYKTSTPLPNWPQMTSLKAGKRPNEERRLEQGFDRMPSSVGIGSVSELESEAESLERRKRINKIKKQINYWVTSVSNTILTAEKAVKCLEAELLSLENIGSDSGFGH